ncbi:MAG: hypothetical protein ACRDYA_11890 [Egibacteraceae bacterium]
MPGWDLIELLPDGVGAVLDPGSGPAGSRWAGMLDWRGSRFCDRWQRGVDHLAEDGKELANRLVGTANAYFGAEQSTGDAVLDVAAKMQDKLKDWSWTV